MTLWLAALLAIGSPAGSEVRFHAAPDDVAASEVQAMAGSAVADVERFFGHRFPRPVEFDLVPGRAAFDAAIPARLGMTPTQCWMVGMGIAERMLVLSPSAWKKDACEHDPGDKVELRRLITHELIHVYHGQNNASGDFTGEDDLAWFIEGIAVLGSGQLTDKRLADVRAAAVAGNLPSKLDDIWTGKLRYGAAGSLAGYVDGKWGRKTIYRLLRARSTKEALAMLGVSEADLIAGWKRSLTPA